MSRRWRLRAGIVIAALAAYAIVGFFVVPWIARSQIETLALRTLHRETRIERVRFNPFTLAAEVFGLEVKDRDGADLFKLERLAVNFEVSGLFRRAWRFRDIQIDRPRFVARILADGRPSIADLFEAGDAPPPDAAKKPFPRVIVDRLVLRWGSTDFVDETRTPRFVETLAPLDLDVHELITIPEEGGEHVVTIGIGERTRIRWTGRQMVEPLRLDGRFEVTAVSLPRVWAYAAPAHALEVRSGDADLAWSYELSRRADGAMAISLKDGTVRLRDVAVRPRGGSEDWLTLPAAEGRGILATWPESRIEIGEIRVSEPHAVAWMDEEARVNWQAALVGSPAEETAPGTETTSWTGKVGIVEIVGGSAHFEDRSVSPTMTMEVADLGMRLEAVSSDLAAPVKVRGRARVNQEGQATFEGTMVPEPLGAELDVAVHRLDLIPLGAYASVSNAELKRGVADFAGKLRVAPSSPRLSFDGEASVDRLEIVDPDATRLLAWEGSRARGIRWTLAPQRLRIANITLNRAFAKVAIDRDGNLNLMRIGASEASQPAVRPDGTPPSGAIPSVDITKIALRDARIDFNDESLILPFGTDIHSASGAIKDLSTTSAAPARLDLEGRIADTGYVKAGGTLRIADPFASSDVNVTFRDVSMPKLTPYVATFAGYAVKDGSLDLDVRYRVEHRRLVGDHRVVAKDLVLGEKVEGASAPGLPVRLAIALLKDKDGRIDLEVPIEGDVDSPEFAYRKVFWQAVRKILANVATAPFRALGRLFGRDEEDLDLIGFASGRSDLLPPEQETLSKLAAELARRPGVSVEVAGRFDPVTDADAIRRARLEQRIDAKRAGLESLEAVLEALYAESFSPERLDVERAKFTPQAAPSPSAAPTSGKKKRGRREPEPPPSPPPPEGTFDAAGFYDALRAQLLAAEDVGDIDLAALARARAAAIVGALTVPDGLEASRVNTADPEPIKRKKQGSDLVASEMTLSAGD